MASAVAQEERHEKIHRQRKYTVLKCYRIRPARRDTIAPLTFLAVGVCALLGGSGGANGEFRPPNRYYDREVDKVHGRPNIGDASLESHHAHADGVEAFYRRSSAGGGRAGYGGVGRRYPKSGYGIAPHVGAAHYYGDNEGDNYGGKGNYGSENGGYGGNPYSGCPFLAHQDYGQHNYDSPPYAHNQGGNGGQHYGGNYGYGASAPSYDGRYGEGGPHYGGGGGGYGGHSNYDTHHNSYKKENGGYDKKKTTEIYGFEKLLVPLSDVYDKSALRPPKPELGDLIFPAEEKPSGGYGGKGYGEESKGGYGKPTDGGYGHDDRHHDSSYGENTGGYHNEHKEGYGSDGRNGYGSHEGNGYGVTADGGNGGYGGHNHHDSYGENNGDYGSHPNGGENGGYGSHPNGGENGGYGSEEHAESPYAPPAAEYGAPPPSKPEYVPVPPADATTAPSYTTPPSAQPPTPVSYAPLSSTTTAAPAGAQPPAAPPGSDPTGATGQSPTTTTTTTTTATPSTEISTASAATSTTTTTTAAVSAAPSADAAALQTAQLAALSIPEPGPQSACPGQRTPVRKCSPLFVCDQSGEQFSCWHEGGKDQLFDAATQSCRLKSALSECSFEAICADETNARLPAGEVWRGLGGNCTSFAYNCDAPSVDAGEIACLNPDTAADLSVGGCVESNQLAACRNS